MLRYLALVTLIAMIPLRSAACPTFNGMDFLRIGQNDVLVEGVIESYVAGTHDVEYVFNIRVISTLKGPTQSEWNVITSVVGTSPKAWVSKQPIYVGFDILDRSNGTGRLKNSPCRPLGIVKATDGNLAKIKMGVVETGSF